MTDQTQANLPSLKDLATIPLTTDDNKAVTLADYVGKRTLLFFFPKAATPGCTTQACGFRDRFPQITEAGAVVLGISADSPADLAKWKADEKLPYTLLSDPDHKIAEKFGVWGERTMFGKSVMGINRSHFVFDADGSVANAEVGVTPADSIEKGTKALIGA